MRWFQVQFGNCYSSPGHKCHYYIDQNISSYCVANKKNCVKSFYFRVLGAKLPGQQGWTSCTSLQQTPINKFPPLRPYFLRVPHPWETAPSAWKEVFRHLSKFSQLFYNTDIAYIQVLFYSIVWGLTERACWEVNVSLFPKVFPESTTK